jgi:ABC-2 type transport system ATP-binding protein/ribosome-dependent ATPase
VSVLAQTREATRAFGAHVAVDAVNLHVDAGELVGLIGANGAGKTTLIRMLLGLLKPSRGQVFLFGERPSRRTRARLGYVPQGLGLYPDLTVTENVAFAARAFSLSPDEVELPEDVARVKSALIKRVGLGRQRQLAFACALSHRPALLVLDEPTSGVSPLARARLWDRIHQQVDAGTGVLVTTHYLQEALQCHRLIVMAAGCVVASGTMEEIIGDRRTVIVHTTAWSAAYDTLRATKMAVTLAGTQVRVADGSIDQVQAQLDVAGVYATLVEAPATLEETMLLISRTPPSRHISEDG